MLRATRRFRTWILCLFLGAITPAGGMAQDLTVFAASSLGTAMEDVAEAWAAETGGDLTVSLAGSSALARQVQAGAPVDVVFLANADWMDALEVSSHIDSSARVDLLSNRLVVIGGWHERDAIDLTDPAALSARLGRQRLALALVEAVPAGIYARAALENLGLWDSVEDRVIQVDNVRVALAFVASRAAAFGIVYATDAEVEPRVAIVAEVPTTAHPPIIYPVAPVVGGDADGAERFVSFLQSPVARAIFAGHGFGMAEGR